MTAAILINANSPKFHIWEKLEGNRIIIYVRKTYFLCGGHLSFWI